MSFLFEGVMAPHGLMKDTKPLTEALVFCEVSSWPAEKRKKFLNGPEGKYLLENDIISGDTFERLANEEFSDKAMLLTVQHMAQENEDERWNEIVRHRAEERRLLAELIGDYGAEAKTYAENARKDLLSSCIPKSYLEG